MRRAISAWTSRSTNTGRCSSSQACSKRPQGLAHDIIERDLACRLWLPRRGREPRQPRGDSRGSRFGVQPLVPAIRSPWLRRDPATGQNGRRPGVTPGRRRLNMSDRPVFTDCLGQIENVGAPTRARRRWRDAAFVFGKDAPYRSQDLLHRGFRGGFFVGHRDHLRALKRALKHGKTRLRAPETPRHYSLRPLPNPNHLSFTAL